MYQQEENRSNLLAETAAVAGGLGAAYATYQIPKTRKRRAIKKLLSSLQGTMPKAKIHDLPASYALSLFMPEKVKGDSQLSELYTRLTKGKRITKNIKDQAHFFSNYLKEIGKKNFNKPVQVRHWQRIISLQNKRNLLSASIVGTTATALIYKLLERRRNKENAE